MEFISVDDLNMSNLKHRRMLSLCTMCRELAPVSGSCLCYRWLIYFAFWVLNLGANVIVLNFYSLKKHINNSFNFNCNIRIMPSYIEKRQHLNNPSNLLKFYGGKFAFALESDTSDKSFFVFMQFKILKIKHFFPFFFFRKRQ